MKTEGYKKLKAANIAAVALLTVLTLACDTSNSNRTGLVPAKNFGGQVSSPQTASAAASRRFRPTPSTVRPAPTPAPRPDRPEVETEAPVTPEGVRDSYEPEAKRNVTITPRTINVDTSNTTDDEDSQDEGTSTDDDGSAASESASSPAAGSSSTSVSDITITAETTQFPLSAFVQDPNNAERIEYGVSDYAVVLNLKEGNELAYTTVRFSDALNPANGQIGSDGRPVGRSRREKQIAARRFQEDFRRLLMTQANRWTLDLSDPEQYNWIENN